MTETNLLTKGERTRQAIMDAAYDLFLEQGFHATSMRQIAERAGLALGGLYNHFSGKDDLFTAIVLSRHPYKKILQLVSAAPGNSVDEFIHNAAQAMVSELERRPDFVRLLFIELIEFDGRHYPAIFEAVFPEVLPLIQRFTSASDALRPLPPQILLRAFLGLFFSYYMTGLLLGDALIPEMQADAFDHFVDIFLHGILSDEMK
ncbi:MAG: TetR/AcrR family transcriptional regulator [Chloroflexi bacterium]|nr:TetR/AcrR family transcriptional regulator [Chloroflexota bacterium]